MLIAQISDTHIRSDGRLAYRKVDTAAYLVRCVDRLRAMAPRPDVVLATGDLVDAGRPDEYARLRALLAPLPMPVFVIPGNHDDREAMRRAFADHSYLPRTGFLQYVIEGYPLRLVALDTLVPGENGGLLCEERLAWIAARLEEAPDQPTVIFMHHPPFLTGITQMDRQGLANPAALGMLIRQHPQVEAVLCGHLHRPIHVRWAGTVASTAPSPAHQVVLDLRDDGPLAFAMEPPACALHLWRRDTGLISHLGFIGQFDGPYPFYEGGQLIE